MVTITQDELKHYLIYVPETGMFFWNVYTHGYGGKIGKGTKAGCCEKKSGYVFIRIRGKLYLAHRLAWLYVHGYSPENAIDHINRNPSDNRISNLREVSMQCNLRNTGTWETNTTGIKGVYWHKKASKWHASICVNRKQCHIGLYDEFDEAVFHRLAAEQCLGWVGCDSKSPAFLHCKSLLHGSC